MNHFLHSFEIRITTSVQGTTTAVDGRSTHMYTKYYSSSTLIVSAFQVSTAFTQMSNESLVLTRLIKGPRERK